MRTREELSGYEKQTDEKNISGFLPKLKKSDFVIHRTQTLFEPAWENLNKRACPFCGNKLRAMIKKKGYYICPSKKHRKSFVVSENKLNPKNTLKT